MSKQKQQDDWNKRTDRRCHITQMREDERALVRLILENMKEVKLSERIEREAKSKRKGRISKSEIFDTLHKGSIVEVNNNTLDDVRVLLRLDAPKKNRAICIVVSLKANMIVTAYANRIDDQHENLDVMKYQWVQERLTYAIPRILGTKRIKKLTEKVCSKSECALKEYCNQG